MKAGFEMPSHETLLAEQARVQADTCKVRLLSEYSGYLFPGQFLRESQGNAIVDFVRPIVGDVKHVTLDGLIKNMVRAKDVEPVRWTDMGGGRALAMRQLRVAPEVGARVAMTNVDLFDHGLEGLSEEELDYLEELAPGMTQSHAAPDLILANAESVILPQPADIITSIEGMQYFNNPLAALCNWYNQLADNGRMIVATDRDWSSWISYEEGHESPDGTPVKHMLEELEQAGITYAATNECDLPSGIRPKLDLTKFRILGIQKEAGTTLGVTQPVQEIWSNQYGFKVVRYQAPGAASPPVVQVSKASF